jgi:hypothetical protein
VLVLAFCLGVVATTWDELRDEEPRLRVTIHPTTPFPDAEDVDHPISSRYWYLDPGFTVEAPERCGRAEGTSNWRRYFNGQPVPSDGEDSYHLDLDGPGQRYTGVANGPTGLAGETIRVTLRAKCYSGGRVSTGTATRTFQVPAASCSGGPLRVLALKGRVESLHWQDNRGYTLRASDLVRPEADVEVSPSGRLELGAPECNSFRLVFFEGSSTVGGYFLDRRSHSTGKRLIAYGDERGGSWEARDRAKVIPLATRCPGCGAANPSTYEVRSTRRRVTVRVVSGAALVFGNSKRRVRVTAGRQASVLCARTMCAPTGPRFFHDGEPWSTPPNLSDRPFRRLVSGAEPPAWKLAPQFSRIYMERLPAAGGAPDQIIVGWSRGIRREGRYGYEETDQSGFLVWERVARSRWRVVYEQPSVFGGYNRFQVGDVTGDGHHDVLFDTSMGSGACGPRRLVAYAGRRTWELFGRDFCEGHAQIVNGALRVEEAVGPCPHEVASAHCRGGVRTTMLRWQGAKLVSAKRTVRCDLARLDPAANCAERIRNTP